MGRPEMVVNSAPVPRRSSCYRNYSHEHAEQKPAKAPRRLDFFRIAALVRLTHMTPSPSATGSLFDAMLQEFEEAARILNLDRGIWRILTNPKRQITVVLSRANGQRRNHRLHRLPRAVQRHARSRKGGVRYHPGVNLDEVTRARRVDDVEVRGRAHPLRRRQGRHHLRPSVRCRSASSKR